MKELKDYTDEELGAERVRRYQIEAEQKKARQDRCEHEIQLRFDVEEYIDCENHETGDLYFIMSEHCKNCYKDIGRYDILVKSSEWSKQDFKKGFIELCKKFGGRVWPKKNED